ncbi:MAG: PQQ-binding-like beta-propeller repeat protein [Candidatus Sumerlaeia bacterium]
MVFASGDWLSIHGDDGNNAHVPVASGVDTLTGTLAWDTGACELSPGAGMALRDGIIYTVAMRDGGNWDPSDDRIWIEARYASNGSPLWDSPPLDAGNSVSYSSISGPTIDPAGGAIYYNSGRSVQRLNPADGSVAWSTRLTTSTTTTNVSLDLINASPAVGGGKVFVETYDDYFGAYRDKLLVALNQSDGSIAWWKNCGGTGRIRPIYLNDVAGGVVVTEVFDGSTSHGLAAYSADGALVWNHLAAPVAWSTARPVEAPFICVDGRIYGVSYSGSGTGQLFCVDAATGSLIYKVDSIESDTAPLLVGDTVYLYGGPFGDAQLVAYRASDGSLLRATTIGGYCFRNAMAATDSHIYLTQSDFFGSDTTTDMVIVNLADGSIAARQTATYNGPVMLDAQGNIYVHCAGGLRAFGSTMPAPSAVSSLAWMGLE